MSKQKLNVGVLGVGFIGPAHIEAIRRTGLGEVVAVAGDVKEYELIKQKAQSLRIPKVYRTWQELISDENIDIVHNCTPNYMHYEINKAIISKGKHIVSEKPLTIKSKESAELLKLLSQKKVVNAINFNYRFYPLVQQAKEMIASKELGDVIAIHGRYVQDWLLYNTDYNWRLDSKVSGKSRAVADIGSHWCDIVQFVSGQSINKLYAKMTTVHKYRYRPTGEVETFAKVDKQKLVKWKVDTEDFAAVIVEFDYGIPGVFYVSQVSAGRKNGFWFEIDGTKGSVAWDQESPDVLWIGSREKANSLMMRDPGLVNPNVKQYIHYPGGHPEGYDVGIKNLVIQVYNSILQNKKVCTFPTFEDGHWENLIVEAVIESNKKQSWIKLK